MQTLGKYISQITPKMNKEVMEGFSYHRMNKAIDYIDTFIKYSVLSKTNTHLRYLGYKEVSPKDEIKYLFNKTSKVVHDIAENDIYLVKFSFQYGDEEDVRDHYFYVPYLNKGNTIILSGNRFLVMPILSDKVISVGDKIIFINILTAKYSFTRSYYTVMMDDAYHRVPVINAVLYKNQIKKLEDTTKANSIIMHYLLANYGYTTTMNMLLGFVPKPVYDVNDSKACVIQPIGLVPHGYYKNKELYKPSNIKFLVDREQFSEDVLYCIGNIYYIIDNFPETVTIDELDNVVMWRRLLGEIIHSGNHGLAYLTEKISAHFNDLNSSFDTVTVAKLKDVNVDSSTLMQLLVCIFKNYNNWIMNNETRSLYHNKTYEVESFVLSHLTSRITRIVLDVNKEELRVQGQKLESKVIDKIFKKYFVTRAIFNLKKEKQYVTSIEYSGDHLYFKNTAMVVQQESDFVNVNNPDVNTSERKKILASVATVGSIFGLSKKNPNPLVRANPYITLDFKTGTVLPHPEYNDIIIRADRLLANAEYNDDIQDNDQVPEDMLSDLDNDDDFDDDEDVEAVDDLTSD